MKTALLTKFSQSHSLSQLRKSRTNSVYTLTGNILAQVTMAIIIIYCAYGVNKLIVALTAAEVRKLTSDSLNSVIFFASLLLCFSDRWLSVVLSVCELAG